MDAGADAMAELRRCSIVSNVTAHSNLRQASKGDDSSPLQSQLIDLQAKVDALTRLAKSQQDANQLAQIQNGALANQLDRIEDTLQKLCRSASKDSLGRGSLDSEELLSPKSQVSETADAVEIVVDESTL